MKWLEIIELRSDVSNRWLLGKRLKSFVKEFEKEDKHRTIKVYSHVSVNSDFSIHLLHDSKKADINGSPIGLQLVSGLKEYGLINHNVWVEMIVERVNR